MNKPQRAISLLEVKRSYSFGHPHGLKTPHREVEGMNGWDGVAHWPTYLLRRVPENLRSELTAQATADDVSVQDVIRGILCAHYNMDCPPVSYHSNGRGVTHPDILLRLQPRLNKRLAKDSAKEGLPVRTLVLQALEAHFA